MEPQRLRLSARAADLNRMQVSLTIPFVVLLRPRVMPIFDTSHGYVSTHGSPWDYDRRVPILFWRRGMQPFEQPLAVEAIDIMPTLAALIGLPVRSGSIDGRCLDLLAGPESSCPPD